MAEDRMLSDEILLGIINSKSGGGGGGGTDDYNDLKNQPQIGGVTLQGNKTASDLGLVAAETGKGLSTNDYTDADKAIVGGVTAALAGKQGVLTAGDYIDITNNEISVNRNIIPDNTTYNIKHVSQYNAVVTKYINGVKQSENNYKYWGGTVWTIDDAFKLVCDRKTGGGGFAYQLLADTIDHTAGYYEFLFDLYETSVGVEVDLVFPDEDTSGQKLIIKSELDAALADKQDKSDNALQTTDKTIVGAINEHEGDISSLKSGFTNLDNEVNGDATTYPYADVITIEDAVPSNLADCSVKIEPVQDLHGYDKPWVGGANTNKYDDSTKLENKMLLSGGNYYDNSWFDMSDYIDVTGNDGYVTMSWDSTLAWYQVQLCAYDSSKQFISDSYINYENSNTRTHTFVVPNNAKYVRFSWAKQTSGGSVGQTNIRVNLGNTDLGYAPYSNICPISGSTEASVQRDGVNLFDVSTITTKKFFGDDGSIGASDNWSISDYISVKSNEEYTLSGVETRDIAYHCFYDSYKNFISSVASNTNPVVIPNNAVYCRLSMRSETPTLAMFELGSSATDYEPYQGKTYTIALGDTIYGGTVDFDSGVMTVDRAVVDLGTLSWRKHGTTNNNIYFTDESAAVKPVSNDQVSDKNICSDYDTTAWDYLFFPGRMGFAVSFNGRFCIANPDITTLSDFETSIADTQICYELATPFTVQLTPQQIQLLKGTNTLTASTGQISVTVNGVSGSIGSVQEQVNATDAAVAELAADIAEQLPSAPTTDGAYVLTVTVADGTPTYSWVSTT